MIDDTRTHSLADRNPWALHESLISVFTQRCWATLSEWNAGTSTRSRTFRSLQLELVALAEQAPALTASDCAVRLASAYGTAAAISCRADDDDTDSSDDISLVGESVADLELNLSVESRVFVGEMDAPGRTLMWVGIPERIRWAADQLSDNVGDATSELVACVALLAAFADS